MTTDEGEDPARSVWLRMRALVNSPDVTAAEHAFMNDVGLAGGPVRALRGLLDGGPQSMRALADRLGCDKSYVTSLVKPLVGRGLAALHPEPSDGRVKIVRLTEEGIELARRARAVYERPPEVLQRIDVGTLREIAALLGMTRG